jgi:undecaprenyl-diphosphatase
MDWLAQLDIALFRWGNRALANEFLDGLMPLVSGRSLLPVALLIVAFMGWRMGRRGLLVLVCLAAVVGAGEALVIAPLKDWIGRPRPPLVLPGVRLLLGIGSSGSMPSAHAANWFCAATVLGLLCRPSLVLTLPLAALVSFSRVYTGVHFPADIAVGAILGACYGAAGVLLLDWVWMQLKPRLLPRASAEWRLLRPVPEGAPNSAPGPSTSRPPPLPHPEGRAPESDPPHLRPSA